MENNKDLLKTYLAGLKKTVVPRCVHGLYGWDKNSGQDFRRQDTRSQISKIQQTSWTSQKYKTKLKKEDIRISMHVPSLYTNISQAEGINILCNFKTFQLNEQNYLQTHGTAMATKKAVAFANIFMVIIWTQIFDKSATKPLVRKNYIDHIISLRQGSRQPLHWKSR